MAQIRTGASRTVSPLWAVLAFAFVHSIGTGVVAAGIFFISHSAFGFASRENFILGLLFGVTYIPAALYVGPGMRRLVRLLPWLTSRGLLGGLTAAFGVLCLLPVAASRFGGGEWTMWVIMAMAGPLSGAIWPVVESFVSGGRLGTQLRWAVGRFNIVWAAAMVVAFWLMAPLVEAHALLILGGMGICYLLCIGLLRWFATEPGVHVEVAADPQPAIYRNLLGVFRVQLPASFVLIAAIEPYLPTLIEQIGLEPEWRTPAASTWLLTRVGAFVVMERWHGWHGRLSTSTVAGGAMIVGFALAIGAPLTGSGMTGLLALLTGLAIFGAAAGVVYAAALYYAMEVGRSGVDAGGMHEALIGLGYTTGPLCGLAAIGISRNNGFEGTFIGLVSGVSVLAALLAYAQAYRARRG